MANVARLADDALSDGEAFVDLLRHLNHRRQAQPELPRRTRKEEINEQRIPQTSQRDVAGLVGKGDDEGQEPPISLERMLELTANAEVDGQKFEGIDYFLFLPHTDPEASDDELKKIADLIAGHNLKVGSLVAPIWPGTVGDTAMGDDEAQKKFILAVEKACRIAKIFNDHGVREYGCIRIDSAEFGVEKWREDPGGQHCSKIAETHFAKLAAKDRRRPWRKTRRRR